MRSTHTQPLFSAPPSHTHSQTHADRDLAVGFSAGHTPSLVKCPTPIAFPLDPRRTRAACDLIALSSHHAEGTCELWRAELEDDAVEDEVEDEIDLAALDPLEAGGRLPPSAAPSRPTTSRPASSGVPVLSELPSHYATPPSAAMLNGGLDEERWSRRREEPSDVELTQKGQTDPGVADGPNAFSANRACIVM